MYRLFCQATGYGGEVSVKHKGKPVNTLKTIPLNDTIQPIIITFNADTSKKLPWTFISQQREVKVIPGETALAFFTAKNNGKEPITGVATYNVIPMKAGSYFNKVQCFCFDEQKLEPNEEVDMPVFFFIDPEFLNDPKMKGIDRITLSYTFFRTEDL